MLTRHIPSYENVIRVPAMSEFVVVTKHVDDNGHMGFKSYLEEGMESLRPFLEETVGVTQAYKEAGSGLFVAHHALDYIHEALLGQRLTAHTLVRAQTDRTMTTQTYLANRTTKRLTLVMLARFVHVSLRSRTSVPFPPASAQLIHQLVDTTTLTAEDE